MPLIVEPLCLALNSLRCAYEESQAHEDASSALKETLQAGVIQNFEVAYELSWKFMKRWLEYNDSADAVNALSRKDLFRVAYKYKLIADPKRWFQFHPCVMKAPIPIISALPKKSIRLFRLLSGRLKKPGRQKMISLSVEVQALVQAVLSGAPCPVGVCGSRVRGTARPASDLNLVFLTEDPLPVELLAEYREAFAQSDLPFRVDCVDYSRCNEGFKKLID